MAVKSRSILFVLLTILVASISYQTSAKGVGSNNVGGWKPVPSTKDRYVVSIAKFALAEHNKRANDALVFVAVVKGELLTAGGKKYKLEISAKEAGAASKNYEAVVLDRHWKKPRQLTSFKKL
ncbi:hypothetical protein ACJIZ3_006711 [Penstemon smallii]|uniref:Cystatin domain-containing protein n=1 Tax=Penstemon smallii TaxID=265156 RepID=A0ABD3S8G2_9LAMI